MIKKISYVLIVFSIIVIYSLLYSCAQVGSISGGNKDTIPPKIRYSVPAFLDTNFLDKEVKFVFDEYFVLNNVNQEFLSSPPFSEKPDIKMKKKKLYIQFNEKLKDSTTYTFYFGEAIEDLNEGNLLKNPSFTFSNYNKIDSFFITGNIKNAFDLSIPESSLIMVYDSLTDSIPYLQIPSYLCKPDTGGNFTIEYIKQKKYKIFALSDLNGDMIANYGESIAFLDSTIFPEREIIEKTDSLKAGWVLHDIIDSTKIDTLLTDTVIITRKYNHFPNNLDLFMFVENDNYQRINDFDRNIREKISLSFDKKITKSYKFAPLNSNFNKDSYLFEKNLTSDTLIYWLKDSSVYNIDTLKFSVSYMSEDSLRKPKLEIDTLNFNFKEKKKKDDWKRNNENEKIEYLKFQMDLSKKTLDLNKNVSFTSNKPIQYIDTNNVTLYKIQDTTTIDTKKQQIIKAQRIDKNKILLSFSRKIIDSIYFKPINFINEEWVEIKKDTSNKNFELNIINEKITELDSIKFICYYDNDFFLNQIEHLKDTVNLSVIQQNLKYGKREEPNKIKLIFEKPVRNFKATLKNFKAKKNWYHLQNNIFNDTVIINISDKELIMSDTVSLDFISFDYIKNKEDTSYHIQTADFVFKENIQFLSSAKRYDKNMFNLIFNKNLYGNVKFEAINFALNTKWYDISQDSSKDTLVFNINDSFVADMDSIKLKAIYKNKDRKNNITNIEDTILLVNDVNYKIKNIVKPTNKKETEKKEETVHIYLPQKYEIKKDSLLLRKYYIKSDWKENFKYKVSFDSIALIDIYNHYNKEFEYEFSVQKKDYYSNLSINLQNVNPLKQNLDSLIADSLISDSIDVKIDFNDFEKNKIAKIIGHENFIIQLFNNKNILVKDFFIKKDELIKIDFLYPGKYKLKMIFDKNNNEKWDSGNYFEKKLPERVLFYQKTINLESGVETKIDWNIGKQLIDSFK